MVARLPQLRTPVRMLVDNQNYLPRRYPTVHRFDNRQTVRLVTAGFTTGYMRERPKRYLSKKEA